ncbi:MAG: low molecular weight protein-tyrosine-phosphatase [Candidatus Sulfotelmatobacter sp.]
MADEEKQSREAFARLQPPHSAFRKRWARRLKTAGRKLLPEILTEEVRRYRDCEQRERLLYLRIRLLSSIGFTNPKHAHPPRTARSFLFVCFGNIMRSPMCEALMIRALSNSTSLRFTVTSAGLNAVPGTAAHPWAVKAAQELGISLENHRARLLNAEMVNRADAIFAMDYQNQVQLLSRYSQAKNKVFMLGAFAGEDAHLSEIRDPYHGGEEATRSCYKILGTCIQNLVGRLSDSQVVKILQETDDDSQ